MTPVSLETGAEVVLFCKKSSTSAVSSSATRQNIQAEICR